MRAPRLRDAHEPPNVAIERSVVVSTANVIWRFAGLLDGQYWARTSDPKLAETEQGSPLFAEVRTERLVDWNQPASEHLSERERTSTVAIVAM